MGVTCDCDVQDTKVSRVVLSTPEYLGYTQHSKKLLCQHGLRTSLPPLFKFGA